MRIKDLLRVEDLTIAFPSESGGMEEVVKHIDFTLGQGEALAIVGESGSGKSLSSLAIMGLLPANAKVASGSIRLKTESGEVDLIRTTDEKVFQKIRGNVISMIFQEPMTSLNPLATCGNQVAEVLRNHRKLSFEEAKQRTIELFDRVELPRPKEIFDTYPHLISGGQKQRVMIAMAVACEPALIIADEPTTALDVTVQKKVLEILRDLCNENNSGLIFITHDLGVVQSIADRVLVLYRGQRVEEGTTEKVLSRPDQPYTRALISCRPRLNTNPRRLPIVAEAIEGLNPKNEIKRHSAPTGRLILSVKDLSVSFPVSRNSGVYFNAVDGVNFEVKKGETLGLVGESGCGKSTLGKVIVGLQKPTLGSIDYESQLIVDPKQGFPASHRKKIQIIFQDPYSSLNPSMTIGEALLEPLIVHRIKNNRKERQEELKSVMDKVGMPVSTLGKYPHQFSGGQRQRICIARTLMVRPEFIVCDESVSALDVSVQAMVLNLLNDLKDEFGLTYIFISHDLSVVKYMADRIMVMRKGKIVESGTSEEIYKAPKTDYTKLLLESIPEIY